MLKYLVKKYIGENPDPQEMKVRERYGTLLSLISIVLNLLMVCFKLIFGSLTGSVAIVADAYNNLSDSGSNLACLFGFKLASKHPDAAHPYGHGRVEYIIGMLISFLVLFVGFSSFKEAIIKIITPTPITFSLAAAIALFVSIILKAWLGKINKQVAREIDSVSLLASAKDSFSDALLTSATLISLCLSLVSKWPFDGIIAAVVSLLVLRSGFEIFMTTLNPLLGMAPDPQLLKEVISFIKSYPIVRGVHDLMMHDYGPGRKYMSFHAEVDGKENIMVIHDAIDVIEKDILNKFNILTTIHMDPLILDDAITNEYCAIVKKIVHDYNDRYSIHDFRLVKGPTHSNLIFDVVLPVEDTQDHAAVAAHIQKEVSKINPDYFCVIQVEHGII